LDDIIIFHRLLPEHIRKIVKLQLAILATRLAKRNIQIVFTESLVDYLAKTGYDPAFGARPLKRLIQKELEDALAKRILGGSFTSGIEVKVDYTDAEGIVIRQ
jgi:ATP-dependent Clp protease ATP-binding subunit ClpB